MIFRNLKYFVEVAEQKSMNKAAARLYVSQPSLTRAIQNLEEELGVQLLIRTNHGVELTEAGESTYYYAKSISGQVDTLEKIKQYQAPEREYRGLGISVSSLILSDDLMMRYTEMVHARHLDIHIFETTVEALVEDVAKLQSDFGLLCVNTVQYPVLKRVAEIRELEVHEIDRGPIYIQMSEKNPIMQQAEIKGHQLLEYTNIRLPKELFSNLNYAIQVDAVGMGDIKRTITMNNYHSILCMLKNSDSFIFGNKWQMKELEKGGIQSRRLADCEYEMRLLWIKRKREIMPDNVKKFLDLCIETYSQ